MSAGLKEEYSYSELAEMWGLSLMSVSNRASEYKIPRFKKGRITYIKAEDADRLKAVFAKFNGGKRRRQGKRPSKVKYWRVSVYDDRQSCFIVKKCSLTREEAEYEQIVFESKGFIARIKPCA